MRRLRVLGVLGATCFTLLFGAAGGRVAPAAADTTVPWHGVISAHESDVTTDGGATETQRYSADVMIPTSGNASISYSFLDDQEFPPQTCPVPPPSIAPTLSNVSTGSPQDQAPVEVTVNPDNAVSPTSLVSFDARTTGNGTLGGFFTINGVSTDICGRSFITNPLNPLGFGVSATFAIPRPVGQHVISGTTSWTAADSSKGTINLMGLTLDRPTSTTTITYTLSNLADSDGDGLPDDYEMTVSHTDPFNADSDNDGLTDGQEVNSTHTDPLKADTDGDGWPDGFEVTAGTDPLDPNSHPPGTPPGGSATPPTFTTTPADPTVAKVAPPATTAPVSFTIAAIDSTGSVPVSCDHTSGSSFALGSTKVTCLASNTAGTTSFVFHVVVQADQPPLARNDSFSAGASANAGVVAPLDILANDTDPDQDPLGIGVLNTPSCGLAVIDGIPGAEHIDFYPPPGGCPGGQATFTYRATDGMLNSNLATVTIRVLHLDAPPTAVTDQLAVQAINPNDPFTTYEGSFNVIANDRDPDRDHLHLAAVIAPTSNGLGSVTCAPNGYCRVIANNSTFSFDYVVSDGRGATSRGTVYVHRIGGKLPAPIGPAGFSVGGKPNIVFECDQGGGCAEMFAGPFSRYLDALLPSTVPGLKSLVNPASVDGPAGLCDFAVAIPDADVACGGAVAYALGVAQLDWTAMKTTIQSAAARNECLLVGLGGGLDPPHLFSATGPFTASDNDTCIQ